MPARFTCTARGPTDRATAKRLPRRRRAPGCSSWSSPTTAMRPASLSPAYITRRALHRRRRDQHQRRPRHRARHAGRRRIRSVGSGGGGGGRAAARRHAGRRRTPIPPSASSRGKTGRAPVAGLEWLNLDSGWRDESVRELARAAVDSLVRPGPGPGVPSRSSNVDASRVGSDRGDGATIVGLAGHDAHGGLAAATRGGESAADSGLCVARRFASYESSFATFARAGPARRTADGRCGGATRRRLLDAMRAGRALHGHRCDRGAGRGRTSTATHGSIDVGMGDEVPSGGGAALTFRSTLPAGARPVLLRDGVDVAESAAGSCVFAASGARRLPRRGSRRHAGPCPGLSTNPIYLRRSSAPRLLKPSSPRTVGVDGA